MGLPTYPLIEIKGFRSQGLSPSPTLVTTFAVHKRNGYGVNSPVRAAPAGPHRPTSAPAATTSCGSLNSDPGTPQAGVESNVVSG